MPVYPLTDLLEGQPFSEIALQFRLRHLQAFSRWKRTERGRKCARSRANVAPGGRGWGEFVRTCYERIPACAMRSVRAARSRERRVEDS
jgi:hypothetical protein